MKPIRSIAIAALCLFLTACANTLTQPSLENDLNAAVQKLEMSEGGGLGNGILRMNYVTRFSWENLYIFGPGSSGKQINRALGFEWQEGGERISDLKEGESLLVFTEGDEVVRYVHCKGKRGRFAERVKPLTPSNAVFQGVREKGRMTIRPVSSFE
ncbi:hypothetical protein C8P63_1429 [Melghirimyces profundicolus]|uniref:Lipoprotein n=1 Tax=Melghirimyces profundicolus TaxID=1242148 RepID=A0A2T6AZ97_9BACL|nr:hypothetical protein [Melghirimyces profundicolus]PTX49152.1 hypothetical protein C8P63_1429 [Melghirimyces profundicolus]